MTKPRLYRLFASFPPIKTAVSLLASAVLCVLFVSQTMAAERSLVLDPIEEGAFPVGSTNFTINDWGLTPEETITIQSGANENGNLRYVTERLALPEDAFFFQLDVPNDASLYGDQAGTVLPYAGYVLYPTSSNNSRADYRTFEFTPLLELPRMQGENEAPIFADDAAQYPLLVYSHGNGGHPTDDIISILVTMASHGYIVMALYHGDRRFDTQTPQHLNLRPLAVKTAVDELLADPDFAGHINEQQIGGFGESFGGTTMFTLLGARRVYPDVASVIANNLVSTETDPRFKAAAAIVPYTGKDLYSAFGSGNAGTSSVTTPFMVHAGTNDDVADYDKIQNAVNNLSGDKLLIEYDQGHAFNEGAITDSITWIKLFLDAYVREDPEAMQNFAAIQSVSGGEDESLVVVDIAGLTDASSGGGTDNGDSGDSGGSSEPTVVPATYDGTALNVPGITVDDVTYDLVLNIATTEPMITFTLGDVTTSTGNETSGSYADGILTLPTVSGGGVSYSVQLQITSDNPVTFTVIAATQL